MKPRAGGAHWFRVLSALALAALAPGLRAGGSGADFLLVEPSARAAGLAGAQSADHGQLEALRYNPAGLADLAGLQAVFSHLAAGGDWSHDWLGLGYGWGRVSLGLDLLVSQMQPLTLVNASGQAYDTAQVDSQNLGLAAAVALAPWLQAGAVLRGFRSQIYTAQSQGWAVDAGLLLHAQAWPVGAGLALQNLGGQSAYVSQADPLPLLLRAGLQADFAVDRDLDASPRLDWVGYQDSGRPPELRVGADFGFFRTVHLRAGWVRAGTFSQPCLGLGVAWQSFVVDYAYQAGDDLGPSQMLDLRYLLP
jgi:hypothetical protein